MAFGKEIKRLRKIHNVSAQVFADCVGIDAERLRAWEKGDFNPREEDTQKIENYFGIQLTEFDNIDKLPIVPTKDEADKKKKGNSYIEKRRNQKLSDEQQSIPIFEEMPYTLTNTTSYRDAKQDSPDFWVTIPGLRHCNYGCRASGDSMHPMIRNHALVIGQEITDYSFLIFGEVYIIQAKNGLETIKYIHPHPTDNDMLMLVPYNEKAMTTPIRKEEILKVYKAKAVFNVL